MGNLWRHSVSQFVEPCRKHTPPTFLHENEQSCSLYIEQNCTTLPKQKTKNSVGPVYEVIYLFVYFFLFIYPSIICRYAWSYQQNSNQCQDINKWKQKFTAIKSRTTQYEVEGRGGDE